MKATLTADTANGVIQNVFVQGDQTAPVYVHPRKFHEMLADLKSGHGILTVVDLKVDRELVEQIRSEYGIKA